MNELPLHSELTPADEGDLLALVEGTPLPPDRAARLREMLAADPRLAELTALLRADRETLCTLPVIAAPADLLDRVEAQLEREALVGLARTEASASTEELPVSFVIPARPRPVWMTRTVGAPLAAAAAVALIAGGALLMVPGGNPKSPLKPAGADDAIANADNNSPQPASDGSGTFAQPTTVIANAMGTDGTVPGPDGSDVFPAAIPPTVAAVPPVAAARPSSPALSTEQILAAANEGRLVLRLRTPNDDAAFMRVTSAQAAHRSTMHIARLDSVTTGGVSQALANSLVPRPVPVITPIPAAPDSPAFAGNRAPGATGVLFVPLLNLPGSGSSPDEPAPVLSGQAYVAALPCTPEGLELLRRSIASDGVPADWQVLAEPFPLSDTGDAASILWWTAPASTWSRRVSLPIVVQSN